MRLDLGDIIGGCGCITVVGILLLVVFVFGVDIYLSMRYGVAMVKSNGQTNWVKEIREERDGCVFYTDVFSLEGKACGVYTIERFNK